MPPSSFQSRAHGSENTGWGWYWPRLIDKVLTRHVDPGQMVRQLVTYGSDGIGDFFVLNGVLVRVEPVAMAR